LQRNSVWRLRLRVSPADDAVHFRVRRLASDTGQIAGGGDHVVDDTAKRDLLEGLVVEGCAMASDAFFPFRDGIDVAAEYGIKAIVQPGGSKRDDEVIAAADEHGMAMVFTGMRHFRH